MIITGLDIETTGLDQAKGHRIIEVAAIIYDYQAPDNIIVKAEWSKRINPQRPIDPGAQAVHGISFEDLAMEQTWEQVAPTVQKILKSSAVVIAHNGDGFDLPFITMEMVRIGMAPVSVKSIDSMTEARWATPNGKFPKLMELCFALGIPYDKSKAHAALYDVQVMMACFFEGVRKGFYNLPMPVVAPAPKELVAA